MQYKFLCAYTLFLAITLACSSVAQTPRSTDKAEVANFHRLILALKEYQDERKKIPKLQKQNHGQPVKILVEIDKPSKEQDDDAPVNILTGYIREQAGADTTNAYVIEYDKVKKTITSVKNAGTPDTNTKEDQDDNEKVNKGHHKKVTDEDADDPDTKPAKHHKKSDDDE